MDANTILIVGLCVAMSAFFSVGRTVADNLDTDIRGWKLVWLMAANLFMGIGGGLITVPATELLGWKSLKLQLLIAAVIGWMGLAETMKYIRTKLENQLEGGTPHDTDSQPDGPGRDGTDSPAPVQKDP